MFLPPDADGCVVSGSLPLTGPCSVALGMVIERVQGTGAKEALREITRPLAFRFGESQRHVSPRHVRPRDGSLPPPERRDGSAVVRRASPAASDESGQPEVRAR